MTGYGTGGTFHGAGKYIKSVRPDVKIVLAEPAIVDDAKRSFDAGELVK